MVSPGEENTISLVWITLVLLFFSTPTSHNLEDRPEEKKDDKRRSHIGCCRRVIAEELDDHEENDEYKEHHNGPLHELRRLRTIARPGVDTTEPHHKCGTVGEECCREKEADENIEQTRDFHERLRVRRKREQRRNERKGV